MSKRANGEGSVYQRKDGRWTGATYVLLPDGARTRRQVYGSTRAEVAGKLRELITQTDRGVPMAGTSWTVDTYSQHWLEIVSKSLKPKTHSGYDWIVRKYIRSSLGDVKLERLTPAHVRRLHTAVAATGVSVRTVQLTHAVLRSMLSEAVREEHITRNVASLVRAPRPEVTETKPWTPPEVTAFSARSKQHRLHALFLLGYSVGLRRGEILGLRWSDLDLDSGALHVRQTLQRLDAGRGIVVGPPKTNRSRRTIPLPRAVVDELGRHRQRQAAELADVSKPNALGLVFTTTIGTPIEPSNLRREFDALIEQAGVRRIRFHDLRHTCASLLFAQGVPPRVVMDLLGHTTLSITTDLYAHVMPTALADAASAMDGLLTVATNSVDTEEHHG